MWICINDVKYMYETQYFVLNKEVKNLVVERTHGGQEISTPKTLYFFTVFKGTWVNAFKKNQ